MGVEKQNRGLLRIDGEECKGCGLCVEACPPKVIALNDRLNPYGYRTAIYAGSGCTACGICFLVCPEPGAITVLRRRSRAATLISVETAAPGAVLGNSTEGATQCGNN
jgi:2-oxoglutarate ferredoxin oxidoreductase subunit delta